MDARGCLRLLGRLDRVINTGGEKVDPAHLEKQIRATKLVGAVRVVGLPDAEWGERVAAIYTGKKTSDEQLRAKLRGRIAAHAMPKIWIHAKNLKFPPAKKF
jgi:O-succinylbenzoic acid--CoA ligase